MLSVWLPLNGNLDNQGLANVSVTNNGATVDTAGKLGSCYSFDGTDDRLSFTPMLSGASEWSVAAWIKPAVANNGSKAWCSFEYGTYWQITCCGTTMEVRDDATGLSGTRKQFSFGAIEADTWVHLVGTYKSGTVTTYKNGVQVSTGSTGGSVMNTMNGGRIGSAVQDGYYWNGKMNDIRIYDHALSPLEVKHLAQGLVLHYPLSDAYIESTANLLPLNVQNFNCTNNDPLGFLYETSQHGSYTLSGYITRRPTTNGAWVSPRITLRAKYSSGSDTIIQDWNSLVDDGEERFINLTITTDSSRTLTRIYGWILDHSSGTDGSKNTIGKNMQLEFKDHATPYTSSTRNENIVYDTSGFCNNGTVNGQFSISTDTPRYNVSTYASGSASTYLSGSTLPAEAKTVSLWIKCNKTVNSAIFSDKTSGLQIGLLNSLLYINSLASTPGFTTTHWVNDEWNHVVAINDNGNRSVYINGQPETQSGASNYYIHNNDNFYLWKRAYNDSYTYNGALSDFRIYATCLSPQDVRDLYAVGASISDNGTLMASEVSEL